VTTYAENIGVMAITRVYSTLLFVIAALLAILLGFSPKFGALVGSIPTGVLGGVGTVLFGLIAVTGARIWVTNQGDFSRGVNLFVAAVVLIVGAADYTLRLGDFELGGIGLGTFGAIILYQLFKRVPGGAEAEAPAEVVRNQQSPVAELSAIPRRGSAGSGRSGRSARRGRRR
jgi:xanthine/uracil permease